MSEHITHLAVAEDTARLAQYEPGFHPDLKQALRRYPEAVRLGSVTRSGDMFILDLTEKYRGKVGTDPAVAERMAYVLGWAGHRVADRIFKPVFRMTDLAYYVRGYPGPSHASVYHDAVTFAEVYDNGRRAPFQPGILQHALSEHPAATVVPVAAAEPLLAAQWGRVISEKQGFMTAADTEWADYWQTFADRRIKFYVEVDRYTNAYYQPRPDRVRQYLREPNFFNPQDEILQVVRSLRGKRTDYPKHDLNTALAKAKDQSLYAQAMALGMQFLRAVSDFYGGKIDRATADTQLRIGEPDRYDTDYYVRLKAQQAEAND